ncbi:MAG: BspA family leucine-rich repeat surface protein, partial [Bacteroidales bacterium]|nr:BspA family leucine-rich repeat surface protein [Bacteroidales bacterium]
PADALEYNTVYSPWQFNANITKVKFDDSYKHYKPTSCAKLFYGLFYLEVIEGLENLNTDEVTDMSEMFYLCLNLKTLDLSGFDTHKVDNFSNMFNACPSLTTIYASDKFVIGSSALTTDMFSDNIRLIGSQGTVYNKDIIDGTYAKIDGGEQSKGYFSAKGVSLPAVTSIAIKTLPQTTYSLSEIFTPAYGVVSVTFSGRETQDIGLEVCTITSNYDSTQVGKYTITATFNGKSTTYTVDVVDRDDVFCTREGDTLYVYYGKYKSDAWLLSQYPSASKSSVYKMVIEPSLCDYTPTSYSYKFGNFTNMVKIDGLKNLNLSSVTSLESLFSFNTTLETLDLSTFDTKNVTDMSSMFAGCSSLKTIYVGSKWSTASVTKSVDMFYNCTALKGEKGTKFDSEKINATYARADGGTSAPGYFTHVDYYPYALLEDGTLTFYYTESKPADALEYNTVYSPWQFNANITKVKFDDSYKHYTPTSCAKLFYGLFYLEEIEGLENLNTDEVTDMSSMFDLCLNLKTLDLSGFDTHRVDNFSNMFNVCTRLTTIYASDKFVIGSSALTTDMFSFNIRLIGSKGTVYNKDIIDGTYAKVDGGAQSKGYFSEKGVSLPSVSSIVMKTLPQTTYSLSEIFTPAYGVVSVTFSGREAQDIDLEVCTLTSNYDSTKVGSYDVTATFHGKSTTYTVEVVDQENAYCTIDGDTLYAYYGKYKSGALLLSQLYQSLKENVQKIVIEPSFYDYTTTDFESMFSSYPNVTMFDGLKNLNLSSVTSLASLFSFNTTLETLDLSSFDTKNVTDMSSMFAGCSSLKTIYVGSKWSTASVTKSVDMFYNCTALEGEKGTKFDSEKINATYARADGGTSAPG